jgi:hypothetical protein
MLIAQQRGTELRPRFSLAPIWFGRLLLALVVAALVLGPLSFRAVAPHSDQDNHALFGSSGGVLLHESLQSDTPASQAGEPATTPHSHCVIHCSLASLLFPLLLLGAPLLAARLCCSLSPGLQSLTTPPLSPPPQPVG